MTQIQAPTPPMMADILDDGTDDATYQDLSEHIRSMDEEEQIELFALARVGRGTYGASAARRAHNKRTAEYLTSLPMLGDYLEEGRAAIEQKDADEEHSNLVERVGHVTAPK